MGAPESVTVSKTALGSTADVRVEMQAPTKPGFYKGFWQMQGPDGVRFGELTSVAIVVPAATPTPKACPPDAALVSVINELGTRLSLSLKGPQNFSLYLSAGQTRNICVVRGTYSWTASASGFATKTGSKALDSTTPKCWWWYSGLKVHTVCNAPTSRSAYSPP